LQPRQIQTDSKPNPANVKVEGSGIIANTSPLKPDGPKTMFTGVPAGVETGLPVA
jgi:hypothetical protein